MTTALSGVRVRAGLSGVAVAVPPRSEPVADILARNGATGSEQRLFTKVYELRDSPTLEPGARFEDLLVDVGRRSLAGGRADLVLYGHTLLYQEHLYRPGFADRVTTGLGLPGVPFYGLSHVACTSVLRAVEVAARFLDRPGAAEGERVLVLGGDHGSACDRSRVVPSTTVMGDAAVAFLVGRDTGRYRYLGGAGARDTRFHRSLRMTAEDTALFWSVCTDLLVQAVDAALADAGLDRSDVDWVMPHLSNGMFWRSFSRASGIARDRIRLDLLPERGHTFGVDALASLDHVDRRGELSVGDRCLLVSIGQGAYFRVAVVEVGEG
ncbi:MULTISPECIES: 3-oxoacyl-[acyl-carrier-protein] synthase III C-terminal domain-containing protein [unclassified Saccharothrix]|uniref:3-oxoacyl-[acyl-carrier-protein] synthase III C-terminal domain-containing protein n=1 Tax=unclassified Saccharothrix TaxID=2593673 RepID=UPI00307F88A3